MLVEGRECLNLPSLCWTLGQVFQPPRWDPAGATALLAAGSHSKLFSAAVPGWLWVALGGQSTFLLCTKGPGRRDGWQANWDHGSIPSNKVSSREVTEQRHGPPLLLASSAGLGQRSFYYCSLLQLKHPTDCAWQTLNDIQN